MLISDGQDCNYNYSNNCFYIQPRSFYITIYPIIDQDSSILDHFELRLDLLSLAVSTI